MNPCTPLIASAVLVASFISATAHAALIGRDLNGSIGSFEAYYDTDLNITWLADANSIAGTSYDGVGSYGVSPTDGRTDWENANAWAANLSFTDGVNVYDNWRLPMAPQPDASCSHQSPAIGASYGYCTGSEMGHLFYNELGGTAGQSILTSTDPDLAKFTNIQAMLYIQPAFYWSASTTTSGTARVFNMSSGTQYGYPKYGGSFAWPVSDGDVGIAAIPEPETYTMILAGLVLIGAMARRRKLAQV